MALDTFRARLAVLSMVPPTADHCPCDDFPEITGSPDVMEVIHAAIETLAEGLEERLTPSALMEVAMIGADQAAGHALLVAAAAGYALGTETSDTAGDLLARVDWDALPDFTEDDGGDA